MPFFRFFVKFIEKNKRKKCTSTLDLVDYGVCFLIPVNWSNHFSIRMSIEAIQESIALIINQQVVE